MCRQTSPSNSTSRGVRVAAGGASTHNRSVPEGPGRSSSTNVEAPPAPSLRAPLGLRVRPGGVGVLDVRATLRTHDGALIYAAYQGVMDLGPDGYRAALTGNLPAKAAIQAAPRFLTAHPDYLWLNRLQCLNVGVADFAAHTVSYDTYAVRGLIG